MNFRVLPEASGEAIAAAIWYEERKDALGQEFLLEIEDAFEHISRHPGMHQKLEYYAGTHDIRRCLLARFPYIVIFLMRPSEILVVAIAHTRRMPLYWLERLT